MKNMYTPPVTLIQLPFPSQSTPLPVLMRYYDSYSKEYNKFFPEYQLNEGDLWEAPLWVAHIDGAIGRDDTTFVNLSRTPFEAEQCVADICANVDSTAIIFFSPLAQNLSLASEVSQKLMARGYKIVLGGNMSELALADDYSLIYTGIAQAGLYNEIIGALFGGDTHIKKPILLGRNPNSLGYRPWYRLLKDFAGHVPLIRVNASHGCLFACTFCGDAWTKQLHLVERERLRDEIAEIQDIFPNTKLIYIGDKTFGQSKQGIENLLAVIRPEYGFRLIVQTHVDAVAPWVLDAMSELQVEVVEMGFETANPDVLRKFKKSGGTNNYIPVLEQLTEHGFKVILNVLGGLPYETKESQQDTIQFLKDSKHLVWLYNLYNFVPYPKTPIFPSLRERIIDWNFANWREDQPVVFEPYYQTQTESWEHFLHLVQITTNIITTCHDERRYESASPLP